MGHPVLLACGAAGALALLFGSKSAHAMPANNGGGLQPRPAPPRNLLGPTAQPAPSSGLPASSYTGSDGATYQGDGSGGVLLPTGDDSGGGNVSVPAYNAPPAPSQSGDMGTFSDSDDNSPSATADSGAAGYDPNFLLSPGNPIDASVSGPLDDYASAVAGPYDSYTAAVTAGGFSDGYRTHPSFPARTLVGRTPTGARKARGRVGDGITLGETSGITESQDAALQHASAILAKNQAGYSKALALSAQLSAYGPNSSQAQHAAVLLAHWTKRLAWAKHHYAQVQASVNANQGPDYSAVLQPGPATIGAPLPYRKGRHNPTASTHLPPKRHAVGAPTGLVHDRFGNWTHAYPGHRWGAPPPAGQPIY